MIKIIENRERGISVPFLASIRFRVFALIIFFIIVTIALLEVYTLKQFEKATTIELEHEGLLLSDTLESIITPLIGNGNISQVQSHIDHLVAAREINDIEINVLMVEEEGFAIVASNIADNVEPADEDEYINLIMALKSNKAMIEIDCDDDPDDLLEVYPASHPDHYFSGGQRFLNITTPLTVKDKKGGINLKLSLGRLDEKLNSIRWAMIIAGVVGTIIIIGIAGVLLNRQVFFPLQNVRNNMTHIANGDLNRQVTIDRPDEIGILARDFNSMAQQLERTQSQLHQYLNPMAIAEAYRRASDIDAISSAEEKSITVLFIDIVSFTSLSEKLGPNQTVAFLNRYYDIVTVALVESGGYIDKYVADEIVCIFDNDDHPDRAVEAAQNILDLLHDLSEKGGQAKARIGINTGSCIIADVGSKIVGKLDRTIIGDTVNIAQRIMSKAIPNTALITESTYSALKKKSDDISSLGLQQLKGKSKPIMAYQISSNRSINKESVHSDSQLPGYKSEKKLKDVKITVDLATIAPLMR